jgi:hypothetical protein
MNSASRYGSEQKAIISRASAIKAGSKRYFTGNECCHGHTAERYVTTGSCVECQRLSNCGLLITAAGEPKKRLGKRAPDFTHLTELQREVWYARVRAVKPNASLYLHQPLDERGIIWKPPERAIEAEAPLKPKALPSRLPHLRAVACGFDDADPILALVRDTRNL